VLEEALSQCAAWRVAGRPLVVSVNVSPTNLLEPGFTEFVRHLLKRHGLPAEVLVIEITETCIISDFENARVVIEELRNLGLVVSIDDFGAGFTSLAHLAQDEDTLALVSDFGCEIVQGYYVSRPKPADEVFSWLRARDDRAARSLS